MSPEAALAVEKLLDDKLTAAERSALADQAVRDPDLIPSAVDAMELGLALKLSQERAADQRLLKSIQQRIAGAGPSPRTQVSRSATRQRPARPRRSRRAPILLFVVSALAASLAIVIGVQAMVATRANGQSSGFHLSRAEGVSIRNRSGHLAPAHAEQLLCDGDQLEIGESSAEVLGADGTRLTVDPGARVGFAAGPELRVSIEAGRLYAEVTHQPGNRVASFLTPHARIAVVGTAFTVQVTSQDSRLDMERGEVRVTAMAGGADRSVRGGESVRIGAAGKIEALSAVPVVATSPLSVIPELARWTVGSNSESTVRNAMRRDGGADFLRLDYSFKSTPVDNAYVYAGGGFSRSDLSGFSGLEIRYRGQGTGLHCFIDLRDVSPQGANEAFRAGFPDEEAGWQTRRLRWSDFTRRTDYQPPQAGNDGLDLTGICSVGIVVEHSYMSAHPNRPTVGVFDLAEMRLFIDPPARK